MRYWKYEFQSDFTMHFEALLLDQEVFAYASQLKVADLPPLRHVSEIFSTYCWKLMEHNNHDPQMDSYSFIELKFDGEAENTLAGAMQVNHIELDEIYHDYFMDEWKSFLVDSQVAEDIRHLLTSIDEAAFHEVNQDCRLEHLQLEQVAEAFKKFCYFGADHRIGLKEFCMLELTGDGEKTIAGALGITSDVLNETFRDDFMPLWAEALGRQAWPGGDLPTSGETAPDTKGEDRGLSPAPVDLLEGHHETADRDGKDDGRPTGGQDSPMLRRPTVAISDFQFPDDLKASIWTSSCRPDELELKVERLDTDNRVLALMFKRYVYEYMKQTPAGQRMAQVPFLYSPLLGDANSVFEIMQASPEEIRSIHDRFKECVRTVHTKDVLGVRDLDSLENFAFPDEFKKLDWASVKSIKETVERCDMADLIDSEVIGRLFKVLFYAYLTDTLKRSLDCTEEEFTALPASAPGKMKSIASVVPVSDAVIEAAYGHFRKRFRQLFESRKDREARLAARERALKPGWFSSPKYADVHGYCLLTLDHDPVSVAVLHSCLSTSTVFHIMRDRLSEKISDRTVGGWRTFARMKGLKEDQTNALIAALQNRHVVRAVKTLIEIGYTEKQRKRLAADLERQL
ncbi:hypothetical protein AB0N09_13505 [Streptomyces erythrochromogenes]|uniref:hypothetical protein n=1 Tax=Streptomyces erythrochromogenes TaxID=285574 RepID=UPI0034223B97